jgi:hypothetical protein
LETLTSRVSKPTYEIINTDLPAGTVIENVPSVAVCVATLASFTATVAPATGPVALFTTPLTCFCALAQKANNSKIIDREKWLVNLTSVGVFLFIIQAVFKYLVRRIQQFQKKITKP